MSFRLPGWGVADNAKSGTAAPALPGRAAPHLRNIVSTLGRLTAEGLPFRLCNTCHFHVSTAKYRFQPSEIRIKPEAI
jgi:hypothetical protein